jgi:hypothetical protein
VGLLSAVVAPLTGKVGDCGGELDHDPVHRAVPDSETPADVGLQVEVGIRHELLVESGDASDPVDEVLPEVTAQVVRAPRRAAAPPAGAWHRTMGPERNSLPLLQFSCFARTDVFSLPAQRPGGRFDALGDTSTVWRTSHQELDAGIQLGGVP